MKHDDSQFGLKAFLNPPYAGWPLERILAHFRARRGITYFPVEDLKETAPEKIAGLLANRFEALGETFRLAPGFNWRQNPSRDLEWHIMLHKFYYAVGLGRFYHETGDRRYRDKWVELTESWIDQQIEPGFIASDVTGRRVQNWIFAHYYFVTLAQGAGLAAEFYLKFLRSLHRQVSWLVENLTPGRNHRTLELTAIFLAAVVFPEMRGAADWLGFARAELCKNLEADFLADGVHCEQSTDYHHIVLRNFLSVRRLAKANGIEMPEGFDAFLRRALEFAKYCHKPDGHIPSLSDGDAESYLDVLKQGFELYGDEELLYIITRGERGAPPRLRSRGFPVGGYFVLRSGWGDNGTPFQDEHYLIFDCGPLGRGNHGHFDLLSFELYAHGRSLVVDPGRYTYDEFSGFNWRALFRSTSYHNTVVVDRQNQTLYVGRGNGKRHKIAGPPPDYQMACFLSEPGIDFVHGIAKSRAYEAVHERKILFVAPAYWLVVDILTAAKAHRYDLRFHLSPEAHESIRVTGYGRTRLIESPNLLMAQPAQESPDVQVETGYVSRLYGEKRSAPIVTLSAHGKSRQFHTVLFPYKAHKPVIRMDFLEVRREGRLCASDEATALAIHIDEQRGRFTDYFFLRHREQAGTYCFANQASAARFAFVRVDRAGRVIRHRGIVDKDRPENPCSTNWINTEIDRCL